LTIFSAFSFVEVTLCIHHLLDRSVFLEKDVTSLPAFFCCRDEQVSHGKIPKTPVKIPDNSKNGAGESSARIIFFYNFM